MSDEMIPKVVERLRALADESRVRLLLRLKQSECKVSTLTQELGIAQASVSKHLAILRQVGLVEVDRRGTQAVYRIRDESVFEMCQLVCDGVIRQLKRDQAVLGSAQST